MYTQLNRQQRSELSVLWREGYSQRAIARSLGVSPSTISRELRRNGNHQARSGYHAAAAHRQTRHRRAQANAPKLKIKPQSYLERTLVTKIKEAKWSPEQVCGWLTRCRPAKVGVSVQTVYDWIYTYRRDLLPYLHCQKGKYRRTRANRQRQEARTKADQIRHISHRGLAGDNRTVFGHWEGDTIVSRGRDAYIATFVERKSGYLVARLISQQNFGAAAFATATIAALGPLKSRHRRSLVLDNGPEMALAEDIERGLNLKVYYATPYHSWERGCNENANGLLRYFHPKKQSFKGLDQEQLDSEVDLINNRPRKRLKWQTPAQVLGY